MKSTIIKISILAVLVLIIIGIDNVGAITTGPVVPPVAMDTSTVITTDNNPTAWGKSGSLALGTVTAPASTLDVLGGFITGGARVNGLTQISGKLRVGPVDTSSNITAITNVNTANGLPETVSVSGGHIVYDAKKQSTTRVLCTDNTGIVGPCRDESVLETDPIVATGASAASARFPTGSGAVIAVSPMSIQGNTAALWGQITAATPVADRTAKCYPNATWSGTTLVPGTATSC